MTNQLLKIVFPGYFRDRHYKIYNAKNSLAVLFEDVFYHLNKQVYHTDKGRNRNMRLCPFVIFYNAALIAAMSSS